MRKGPAAIFRNPETTHPFHWAGFALVGGRRFPTPTLRSCQYCCIDKSRPPGDLVPVGTKTEQLQIRVTPGQKAALKRLARGAGQDVSSYVLSRTLVEPRLRFGEIVRALRDGHDHRFALADLHDLLAGLTRAGLPDAVAVAPPELRDLPPLLQNYVAAMVEQASRQREVPAPSWGRDVAPLATPYFATPLRSLRFHLLRAAPVPFKRRNLFVDAGVGARV